ncbi:tRNA 2-thiouridine(34) synthase MnmA [Prosthecochloris sp. GSB1]|uniref:tRNA 2-thiouridine(34) synthase MnmA n=1 Tax=Prosthecochloris sp. GSB1 TaxID=281093 RepID=UPI000B8C909E|nr:tRNA 2-thiouridine(34) synthase MnmA [Prosthecochloris sp. GSB1]ASQ91212.1 tRNA 2-thiouridine(34) synthase MnmA [Prosthecochloris sp. GSB1]
MQQHVVTGISGGVDSAVAACLLVEQGYRVSGVHIRVLDQDADRLQLEPSPMVVSELQDFAFPVYTLNLSGSFREEVIDYFRQEYLEGKTPNPCMVCNRKIKWKGLLIAARMLEAEAIATGHYARMAREGKRTRLLRGVDRQKDQSYFLWMLGQEELSRTLLPLGPYRKPEVRAMAKRFGVRAAEKKESQEICFVPGNDYREFLKSTMPGRGTDLEGGQFVDPAGNVIGTHHGYPFYTVGQRRGLGLSSHEPLYVNRIEAAANRVHVGGKSLLRCSRLKAAMLNWIAIDPPAEPFRAKARIRYRDAVEPCTILPETPQLTEVVFDSPKQSVTPGQAVVFYREDEVLGGGVITEALHDRT